MFVLLFVKLENMSVILDLDETDNTNQSNKILKREHAKINKVSYASPLNPYDRYKDKKTDLYEPRKPGKGIDLSEVDK